MSGTDLRSGRPPARRLMVTLVVAAAVVLMHVLSVPGTSHHSPLGAMSAVVTANEMTNAGHAPADTPGHRRPNGPEPIGHLLAMTLCAFAVLGAAMAAILMGGPRRNAALNPQQPHIRLVSGPEPPVPRFVV